MVASLDANKTEGDIPFELWRRSEIISNPACDLSDYTVPLRVGAGPGAFDFLASLTIDCLLGFGSNELLDLADLKNLVLLELFEDPSDKTDSVITDRLVRGWHDTPNHFSGLQILRIINNQALTHHSLPFILQFPSLRFYDVSGVWETPANMLGWTVKKESYGDSSTWAKYGSRCLDRLLQLLPDRGPWLSPIMMNISNLDLPVCLSFTRNGTEAPQYTTDQERERAWQLYRDLEHKCRDLDDSDDRWLAPPSGKRYLYPDVLQLWTWALTDQLPPQPGSPTAVLPVGKTCGETPVAIPLPPKPYINLMLVREDSFLQRPPERASQMTTFFHHFPRAQDRVGIGAHGASCTTAQLKPQENPKRQAQRAIKPRKRQKTRDLLGLFGIP